MTCTEGLITAIDWDILEGLHQIERLTQEGKFEGRKDQEDVHMNIERAFFMFFTIEERVFFFVFTIELILDLM